MTPEDAIKLSPQEMGERFDLLAADAKAPGGVEGPSTGFGAGTGGVLVVDHTGDNTLVTFRFKNKDVKMLAAEDDFELAGHKFRAGAIIVPNADRARLEPGASIMGPAIVTEFDSTTVVLPGHEAAVDTNYNILINPSA